MNRIAKVLIVVLLLFSAAGLLADEVNEALNRAEELEKAGKLTEAVTLLETAFRKFPENVDLCATLGFYKGMQAGKAEDFMEAGQLVNEAFTLLNQAVETARNAPLPRFYRGILGVNTPPFLGKLEQAINDLEHLVALSNDPSHEVSPGILANGMIYLGRGYEKQNQLIKALETYKKAQAAASVPETKKQLTNAIQALNQKIAERDKKAAATAEDTAAAGVEKSPLAGEAADAETVLAQAGRLVAEKKWAQARKLLEAFVDHHPRHLAAHKMLLQVISELADAGYDENVYKDQDYRTNLAFDVVRLTEKICELDPDDMQMRLEKGAINVAMPFFVNKLDQGIKDLNQVLQGDSTDEQKAQALYYLGLAHQKKMTTYWIQVAKKYAKTPAAKEVFAALRPAMTRLSPGNLHTPCVTIDFVLGFRDELAPQTAVWIEKEEGEFVKTVYVSGFSGCAREKQVNLPQWAKYSEFRDVDGVTGASIDRGHHIYIWDLKDFQDRTVPPGKYRVRVETSFWPSGMYQRSEAKIEVGTTSNSALSEKGNIIPYLEVRFHPLQNQVE